MLKDPKVGALCAAVVWIVFIFAAFKGLQFWYAGFVFFFWLSLAFLNYCHSTSFWIAQHTPWRFLRFYLALFAVGFIGDFVIGQNIAHLWSYPHYNSFVEWATLYAISYPFGGLSILELSFFLGYIFHEKFVYLPRVHMSAAHYVDKLDHAVDTLLAALLLGGSALYLYGIHTGLAKSIVYLFLLWAVLTTVKLAYHLRHGIHWIALFCAVLFISVLLHEVPNTAVFEWEYYTAPILNFLIFEIPAWVFLGWYLMLLVMYRLWLRLILQKRI